MKRRFLALLQYDMGEATAALEASLGYAVYVHIKRSGSRTIVGRTLPYFGSTKREMWAPGAALLSPTEALSLLVRTQPLERINSRPASANLEMKVSGE